MDIDVAAPAKRAVERVGKACIACARKKAKCSGTLPCATCARLGEECAFSAPQKRGPKRKAVAVGVEAEGHKRASTGASAPPREEDKIQALRPLAGPSIHTQPSLLEVGAFMAASGVAIPEVQQSFVELQLDEERAVTPASEADFVSRLYQEGPGLDRFSSLLSASEARHLSAQGSAETTPTGSNLSPGTAASSGGPAEVASPEVEARLYQLFWTFTHPIWPIIYRPAFVGVWTKERFPMLHSSMMSLMCLKSTDLAGLSPKDGHVELGTRYFEQAKAEYERTALVPRVQTVQSLVFMSLREIFEGHLEQAYLYSGAAIRMALALGLNTVKASNFDHAHGDVDEPRAQESRRVIWGCYQLDKYMSLLLGRPLALSLRDIDAPLPSQVESDEFGLWPVEACDLFSPETLEPLKMGRTRTMSNFNAMAGLCEILERIVHDMYSTRRNALSKRMADLQEIDALLVSWAARYPANLGSLASTREALSDCLPHLVYVRLWYHTALLVLHRPFILLRPYYPRGDQLVCSYAICTEAAEAIGELLSVYDETFGAHRLSHSVVWILFQAGIIHVANSVHQDQAKAAHGRQRLSQILGWLDQLATSYVVTMRYKETLLALSELSQREPKPSTRVHSAIASRQVSRQSTPAPLFEWLHASAMDDTLSGVDDFMAPRSVEYPSIMGLYNLHDSWGGSMPLTSSDASWDIFLADYENLAGAVAEAVL